MGTPGSGHRSSALAASLPGIILGAALQLQQPRLWPLWIYALCTAVAAVLLLTAWFLASRARTSVWMVFVAAGFLSGSAAGWRAAAYTDGGLDASLEGRDLVLTGIVAALPHRGDAGIRFRFEPESANAAGKPVRLPPQLLLGWYAGAESGAEGILSLQRQPADLRPGERWQFSVRLKAPHGQVNPHGFDYELWLWEQGVQATGSVRAGPRDAVPQRLAATWAHPVELARQRVRAAIDAQVSDPRLAGILAALVVGDQGAIERADWDVFRATGVAHLMSISGLHITMFAWLAAAGIVRLWRRSTRLCLAWPAQHAGIAGGILLAASYSLFSGWGVPAQRTVLMLAVVGVLRLGARAWPWPWLWLAACAVVVASDPWALTQAGFWLSFVAVGVLFASGPAREVAPAEGRSPVDRLLEAMRGLAREQAIVTVALTPLSLLLFGQVSLVGLLANFAAIPWVTLVITPLGLAGVLFAPLWSLAAAAVDLLAIVLRFLSGWPLATWSAPAPPLWAAAVGVVGGMLLAMRLPWAARLLGVPLLVPVLLWQPARPASGEFELLAADVGQGNAVVVRTATHTLVYDAGPLYSRETDAGQRVLVPLLRALDERVDLLVLSHRDADHTGGAVAVLNMQPQARLLSSLETSHPLRALCSVERCVDGQFWEWDGVRFEILHPQPDAYAAPARPNSLSCVLRVGNGQVHALLAGDIEKPQETALAESPERIRSDWLLVPHHGSRTSSSAAFLDAVKPAIAVAQSGYRNRFGHPAPDVVQRYVDRSIALSASPACGALTWQSVAPSVVRCERAAVPRYWHHEVAPGARNGA
jgi:competence protein ComEC